MQNINQNITIVMLLSQLQNLINDQFEVLGNFLGDLLLILETQQTQNTDTSPHVLEITGIMNHYAESLDGVLSQHRANLAEAIDQLISTLIIDLGRLDAIKRAS